MDHLSRQPYPLVDAHFLVWSLQSLGVHEIGTHILRAGNGRKQAPRILDHGLSRYLLTEERLAEYTEQESDSLESATLQRLAGGLTPGWGTSVGAHYKEVCLAQNRADLIFNSILPRIEN